MLKFLFAAAVAAVLSVSSQADTNAVRALLDAGKLTEAEAAANALLESTEKARGPEASQVADALELLIEARRATRRSTAPGTVALAERLVKIRETTRGPDDVSTATALIVLGRIKASNRDYEGGRAAAERALVIRERVYGAEDLEVANALNAIASIHRAGRQTAQVGAFGGRALALARRLEAPAGIETATALFHLAYYERLDQLTVEPEHVVRMLEEMVSIEERLRPRDHPLNAAGVLALATAYRETGDLQSSRTVEERGIALLEASGTQSYQVAFDMIELATINDALGEYGTALSVAEQAVARAERATSPTSTLTASALHILATMHARLGDHASAVSTEQRVLQLWSAHDPESLHVATTLMSIAESYWALGRFDEAFAAVERALAMKSLHNEPLYLERALQGHARLFRARGRIAEARAALERAIVVARTVNQSLGRIELGIALAALAELEREDGHPERALPYARESLQLLEKDLGRENARTAARRPLLSGILAETGAYDEARKELVAGERASLDHLRIIARTLTDRRALEFAAERQSGRNLAITLATHPKIAAPTDTDMAWRIVLQGRNVVVDEMAARQRTVVAEAENAAVRDQWTSLNRARARLANLVIGGPQGLSPESYQALVERTRAAHDRAERDLAAASATFREEQSRTRAEVRDVLAALPKQTALISYVRYFPEPLPGLPRPSPGAARTSGTTGPAGTSSTSSTSSTPDAVKNPIAPSGPAAYAAFIGHPGAPPRVVALGPAEAIDAAVAKWRSAIQTELGSGGLASRRNETTYREAGAALRRLIWDPVQPYVSHAISAFIVPDGAINLVDFSTLPIDRLSPAAAKATAAAEAAFRAVSSAPRAPGAQRSASPSRTFYLADEPINLHYVLAERDLVQPPPEPRGHSLLALGAPDFEKVDREAAAALMSSPTTLGRASIASGGANARATRGAEADQTRAACEALVSRTFAPLPGTRQEMQQIAELWRRGANATRTDASTASTTGSGGAASASDDNVMLLGDDRASETAFKMLASGRRVLHLATHGFFLDRACGIAAPSSATNAANTTNGTGTTNGTNAARGGAAPVGTRLLAESPLLRSGLVLAGANRRADTDRDEDDGILTAEEIAGLDLSAAQWAVLSACDTGRGDLQAGEGVVGLRRAFQVAGARTVILSLWPVLDAVAADWMAELYRGKFVRGETTAASVRAASQSLLAARRAAGQSTHPLYWSGFIATGDWR